MFRLDPSLQFLDMSGWGGGHLVLCLVVGWLLVRVEMVAVAAAPPPLYQPSSMQPTFS